MRRFTVAVVLAALAVVGFAPAASAGPVTACYSATVTVNGDTVVDEAACLP